MVDKILHDETLLIGKLFAIHFRLIEVSDLTNDYQWLLSAKMISILYVNYKFGFLLTIEVLCTGCIKSKRKATAA